MIDMLTSQKNLSEIHILISVSLSPYPPSLNYHIWMPVVTVTLNMVSHLLL